MSTIVSAHNPRLKALRRLQRRRERDRSGTFLAEGEDLVAAAELAGRRPLEGYRHAGSGLGGAGFQDVEPDNIPIPQLVAIVSGKVAVDAALDLVSAALYPDGLGDEHCRVRFYADLACEAQ